jgi:hypothetical protein
LSPQFTAPLAGSSLEPYLRPKVSIQSGRTQMAFLASDRAANVTGSNYLIDGGLIKTT